MTEKLQKNNLFDRNKEPKKVKKAPKLKNNTDENNSIALADLKSPVTI